jgi:hypothetical protein
LKISLTVTCRASTAESVRRMMTQPEPMSAAEGPTPSDTRAASAATCLGSAGLPGGAGV